MRVGSALAYRGIPLQAAYRGAKHSIKGFTESVITELKHERSQVRISMVTLPGMNTPQFDGNDNGFTEHPTPVPVPVPPIFEPQAAAQAIRFVAEHRRRSMWVGLPTAYTILGNGVAPWFLDWYLGKTGVKGQLSPIDGLRWRSNVFTPQDADTDQGSRGQLGDKSHANDPWSWASMRRVPLAAPGVSTAAAGAIWRRSTR